MKRFWMYKDRRICLFSLKKDFCQSLHCESRIGVLIVRARFAQWSKDSICRWTSETVWHGRPFKWVTDNWSIEKTVDLFIYSDLWSSCDDLCSPSNYHKWVVAMGFNGKKLWSDVVLMSISGKETQDRSLLFYYYYY